MPNTQVRITKTKELQEVLNFLKEQYKGLSEAELCKNLLVNAYVKFKRNDRMTEDFSR